MRTNYFVGIEGTHGEVRRVLETKSETGLFAMFFGKDVRDKVDLPMAEITNYLFGSFPACEENNIGITRVGGTGGVLTQLVEKSPIGTRVFFFKHVDSTKTAELYKGFLEISATRYRIERLTGMTETALKSNPQAYDEATAEALSELNEVADVWVASPWAPFDVNVFFDNPPDSNNTTLVYRVAVKS
jgi:hypothetical protein